MVQIKHDWDEGHDLEAAFGEYRKACYGSRTLNHIQNREIRQAFLSGIHWLNTQESYAPDEIEVELRKLLNQDSSARPHG